MEIREHVTRDFKKIDEEKLMELAYAYCDDCMSGTKEVATGSGKIVSIRDRFVPTIDYFLHHWLRKHEFEFYTKMGLWKVRQDPTHPYHEISNKIVDMFKALATDIVANEGKAIVIVSQEDAEKALNAMREHEYGKEAAIIGEVKETDPGKVLLKTRLGVTRIVDMLQSEQLPRIC